MLKNYELVKYIEIARVIPVFSVVTPENDGVGVGFQRFYTFSG